VIVIEEKNYDCIGAHFNKYFQNQINVITYNYRNNLKEFYLCKIIIEDIFIKDIEEKLETFLFSIFNH